MIHMLANDAATLLNSSVIGPHHVSFTGLSIDTRTLVPGNLYVAIKGESLDGHDFVTDAYQSGASLALVSRKIDCPIPQIIVSDTTLALGKLAENWRAQFALPIIAITGSNGKTTVKNMITAILLEHCDQQNDAVLSTQGNFNNHWGLPLTLAKLSNTHRYAVIEMGMNHFGEIEYLTQLTRPTVALITHAGIAHLEGVGNTVAGVAKAKAEIFSGLQKHGIAILNRDDDFYSFWQNETKQFQQLSFGLHEQADITANITVSNTTQQLSLKTPEDDITISLPLLGEHNANNALAAIAATVALHVPLTSIARGLSQMKPEKGRLCLSVLPSGTKLIDDTYNANPTSFTAAIKTLASFNHHTILVMGDMKELGQETASWHDMIGKTAKALGITQLFTFGALSKVASQSFGDNAMHFDDRDALCHTLKKYCAKNTTILVKGSRSMQMEKVVQSLYT